jgi:hypothetical protein
MERVVLTPSSLACYSWCLLKHEACKGTLQKGVTRAVRAGWESIHASAIVLEMVAHPSTWLAGGGHEARQSWRVVVRTRRAGPRTIIQPRSVEDHDPPSMNHSPCQGDRGQQHARMRSSNSDTNAGSSDHFLKLSFRRCSQESDYDNFETSGTDVAITRRRNWVSN